jgi:hypothetical protein
VPRKPKPPIQVLPEVLNDWLASAKNPIPYSHDLLRPIVKILLTRINRHDEKEAKFLRIMVRAMVTIELKRQRFFESKEQQMPLFLVGFDRVKRGVLSGLLSEELPVHGHYLPTLRIQKALLINFIEKNPVQPSNLSWVPQYEKEILALLIPIPCLCPYTPSLVSTGFSTPDCGVSTARLISTILAHVHDSTTPANIEKLLKNRSPMVRDDKEAVDLFLSSVPQKHLKSS